MSLRLALLVVALLVIGASARSRKVPKWRPIADPDSSSEDLLTELNGFIESKHGDGELSDTAYGGAQLQKNRVKGPHDLELFFPNVAGSCGGMSTLTCSHDCGVLGYPLYWCYPKVCHCHFGNDGDEE